MPYCSSCGTQSSDNARFCAQCGTNLMQETSAKRSAPAIANNAISSMRMQGDERHKILAYVIVIAAAVVIFGLIIGAVTDHRSNGDSSSNAPARIWTEQDEKNRVLQIEESKKRDKIMESIILSACGPSPSNNYPNDSDVPILHMMYQEEHKAQNDYLQCSAQAIRDQEKAEQNIQPKVGKRAKKPD
jgi:zinc-ribbon domain